MLVVFGGEVGEQLAKGGELVGEVERCSNFLLADAAAAGRIQLRRRLLHGKTGVRVAVGVTAEASRQGKRR